MPPTIRTQFGLRLILVGLLYQPALQAQTGLVINEIVTSNVTGLPDEYEEDLQNCPVPDCPGWYEDLGRSVFDGEYPDWIELYNGSEHPLSLEGHTLSDKEDPLDVWTFPDIALPAGGHLVVFASGKDKFETYAHTHFKLARQGETVTLRDPQGQILDQVETGPLPIDHSLARSPEDPTSWIVVTEPTPNAPNHDVAFVPFDDAVIADPPAGFYDRFPPVTLSSQEAETEIRYTLDGTLPHPEATLYTRPITALFGGDRVIRAQCFRHGRPTSPVLTQSYLTERTFNMPVISLTTSPEHLWDEDLGIYTPGRNAREGARVANYWNEWERPVHLEFFEPDGTLGFTADAGLRIFGWGSRSDPQKSFAVMFRDRYGMDTLEYPLFPDEDLKQFQAFVLRAAGSDSRGNGTFFRDPFASSLLKGRNVDRQAFRPAVVYLNGEYWGIQNLREKMNENYLASHHPVDADEIDLISRYWRRRHPVVIEGDAEIYLAFETFLEENDFRHDDAYQEALRFLDFDNYLEYTAAQIYFANFDWPGNNNKNWRPREETGRWRWLMYDLDYSLGFNGDSNYPFNTLAHALAPSGSGWPNPSWTTLIFRKLAENRDFQYAFANRIADLANHVLSPARALPRLEALQAHYAPEMAHHIQRWKREGNSLSSVETWERNIDTVGTFFERRAEVILNDVSDRFATGPLTPLHVACDPTQGHLKLNSITLRESDWRGEYFAEVPVTVTALPLPGYRFSHWDHVKGAGDGPTLTFTPGKLDGPLRPIFEPAPGTLNRVRINEINYHSHEDHDAGDWIELYNGYAQATDVSGWIFQDSDNAHRFVFPQGTSLPALGYLILAQDPERFAAEHPDITALGGFAFGLNNGGERLRLLDSEGQLIEELTYGDQSPWPVEADGGGATLARIDPSQDRWGFIPNQGDPGQTNQAMESAKGAPLQIEWSEGRIQLVPGQGPIQVQRSSDLQTWEDWQTLDSSVELRPGERPNGFFRGRPEARE